MRSLEDQGIDANGVTKHQVGEAIDEVRNLVYGHVPGYEPLDMQYGKLADEVRAREDISKVIEQSRATHTGNAGVKVTAGTLGGSFPQSGHGVLMTALDKILTNRAGAADATARLVTQPGGPEMVQRLLSLAPKASTMAPKARAAFIASLLPSLQSTLVPPQSP